MHLAPRSIARSAAVATASAALMTAGLVGYAASPASAYQGVITVWTPGTYTWTVPAGVTQISVKAYGAQGGGVAEFGQGIGGHGAEVKAIVPVTPGQVITYVVGAQPSTRTPAQVGTAAAAPARTRSSAAVPAAAARRTSPWARPRWSSRAVAAAPRTTA